MVSHEMLHELFLRLQTEFQDLPTACYEFWWTVGFPGVVCLTIATLLGFIVLRIKRMFFMTPAELHREALIVLASSTSSSLLLNKKVDKAVEQLLLRAVKQNYIPARTSLAALYTYRLSRPDDALGLLSGIPSASLNSDELGIQLDAKVVKAGNGHMIQAEIQALEFLSVAYCDVVTQALEHEVPPRKESKKER